jgi:glutathione S-transferase
MHNRLRFAISEATMTLSLYGHPFSSFTEKVLTALYENHTPFTFRKFGPGDPEASVEWEAMAPLKRFPVLVDEGRMVFETSVIIEHLDLRRPGPVRLIPQDPEAALEVRSMDRVFDNYIMTPMLALAFNASRPADKRDAMGAEQARETLSSAYAWLNGLLGGRAWAAGADFSMADCAAAPALLFAHWAHPIPDDLAELHGYRRHLLERPSFARVVDEARPYRAHFPLNAPIED